MTTEYQDDAGDNVRVHHSGAQGIDYLTDRRQRTEPQRHTDTALNAAEEAAARALADTEAAVEWLASIGAPVPTRLETLPVVLRQLAKFVDDERGRRG